MNKSAKIERLRARARALGSKATTIRGMIRAVLAATRPAWHVPFDRDHPQRLAPKIVAYRGGYLTTHDYTTPRQRARVARIVTGSSAGKYGRVELCIGASMHDALRAIATERRADRMARRLGVWRRDDAEAHAEAMTAGITGGSPRAALDAFLRRGGKIDRFQVVAMRLGKRWDVAVKSLTESYRASVAYGHGGTEQKDYPYRGAHRSRPAIWHDAGARWSIVDGKPVLILENSRGRHVATMPMPSRIRGLSTTAAEMTHGDAYTLTTRDPSVVTRYGWDGKKTGVALRVSEKVWEHGATVEECRAEIARKAAIEAEARRRQVETAKEQRRARLLARISERVMVSRDDASAVGACRAGIDGWCARVGIAPETAAMPARDIVRLAAQTGERRAIAAAVLAARRAIHAAVEHGNTTA